MRNGAAGMEVQKVLVIAAHPDDEVLGMGGTIAKYADRGDDVRLLIVTDGSSAQYRDEGNVEAIIQKKRNETRACAAILGIGQIYYGTLPDMRLDVTPHIETNNVIENVVNAFQPSIVFTHFYGDVNKDHRLVFESSIVACRPTSSQCVRKLFLYSVPSSTEWNVQTASTAFLPNWFEDIGGEFAQRKYRAMACYETELREYPHPRSIQSLISTDLAEGIRIGVQAAESFMLVRAIQ